MKVLKANLFNKYVYALNARQFSNIQNSQKSKLNDIKSENFSSKNVRDLFLKYFINEKNHTYVPSSPVVLVNDPSLLFVNAGMNQFRSMFLNKSYPGHPFYGLKRAANSQKCVRLSGKHNDLKDVGVDLYHHTFFEMLGNWSFGDYSKVEACKMAWDLLINVYGLKPENLYVTYFGGDKHLNVPPDEECKNIWLDIGIQPSHIFPFGAKDNFWEMADKGPCGPCSEIHYDFLNSGPEIVAQKINAGSHDVMEIWNLVFVQYNREMGTELKSIPNLNIDTGMGLERLTAVLQGTRSNYDTDLFTPLFEAIELKFRVRPYLGKTGYADSDGLDTAYRILADHSRMFSIAIADGIFPSAYDAGHVLRKIIRRAAYAANRVMKTHPGALSSVVPHVAKTLDFYPEIGKHVDEIIYIVNDEEKMLHQAINKGRKARNKMISDNPNKVLNGQQAMDLHYIYGLEDNIIQDIADEVNVNVDWENCERLKEEKLQKIEKQRVEKDSMFLSMIDSLIKKNIPSTEDSFKYYYNTDKNNYGVNSITSEIIAIFKGTEMVSEVEDSNQCILVTNKTNFYSNAGGQISDIGVISNQDLTFKVENVSSYHGYVFHHGLLTKGKLTCNSIVNMDVEKEHRLSCSQNHTATHIMNSVLRKLLPYTAQRSSHVCPSYLKFSFSAKAQLTDEELEKIETLVNQTIQKKLCVLRKEFSFEELLIQPNAVLLRGEEYPEVVSVIFIGELDCNEAVSIEPCCGTHVHNTADIESFVLIPSKSQGSGIKVLSAVTGNYAALVKENGNVLRAKVLDLKNKVDATLENSNASLDVHLDLLKQIKVTLKECHTKTDAPLRDLNEFETLLKDMKMKLNDFLNATSRVDMNLDDSGNIIKRHKIDPNVLQDLKMKNILPTNDVFKYDYYNKAGVKPISAKVIAVISDGQIVDSVERGLNCQLVLNKTNFYAEGDDQAGDEGILSCKDFVVKINSVYKIGGYVFHDGYVEEGNASSSQTVDLSVDNEHRLACSQNHTALHILSAVLKNNLSYFFPLSANVGPKEFSLNFTTKGNITDDQLKIIEKNVQDYINAKLDVTQSQMPLETLKDMPPCKTALIKEFEDLVPVVEIGKSNEQGLLKSVEPCCGTHVKSTEEVGSFIIISQNTKDKEKVIRAVTGKQALIVGKDGQNYDKQLTELEKYVRACLEKPQIDVLELWDCLKEIKEAKVYHETELPLLLFREHQEKLSELREKLAKVTNSFVQNGFKEVKQEMTDVLKKFSKENFIVHHLSSVGDGRRIINYAIDHSGEKPALYFVKDGYKSIICSCSVPKSFVDSSFSALLWINPVASILEGRARTSNKDQELYYSVVSKRTHKVEQAIDIAKKFIESHFSSR